MFPLKINKMGNAISLSEFKFRAWSRKQADQFLSHIPDLLISDVVIKKWSDSSSDVVVTLQVQANLEQLHTILSGLGNLRIIEKTLVPSAEFKTLTR